MSARKLAARLNGAAIRRRVRQWYRAAAPPEVREGRTWYRRAHRWCVRHSGPLSLEQVCGIVAALSPQLSWEKNLDYAARIVAGAETVPCLAGSVRKALAIKAGADPLAVLGGPKVRAFYRCLLDPECTECVCLDRHAYALALGFKRTDTLERYAKAAGVYDAVAGAFRSVARELGARPLEVQAVTWVAYRKARGLSDPAF